MMTVERREQLYRGMVSTFVVVALGAQTATLAVTAVHPGRMLARLYPIIEYPMYADAHFDGERVKARWLLRGVLKSGGEIDINEQSLGMSIFSFVLVIDPVVNGQPGTPATAKAIQTLRALVMEREPRARELSALHIDSYPMKVTRNGAAAAPSERVVTIPMS